MKIAKPLCAATLALSLAMSLAACQTDGSAGNKETIGTLLGAGLGGLAGSQLGGGRGKLATTAIGVLAGAWLGNQAGQSLDKADQVYAQRNAQSALETNRTHQTSSWSNPDTRASGTFTPTRTFQTADGQNCRDYETTIYVDGKTETAKGTACRQPDGSWRIAN